MSHHAEEKGASTYFDAQYENYGGKKRFRVRHPAHQGDLVVAAPAEEAAIKAAADHWGEAWRRYSFYAYCEVTTA